MRQRLIVLIGILIVVLVLFTLLRPRPKSKVTSIAKEMKPKVKQETLATLPKKEIKEIKKESIVSSPVKKETLALAKPSVKKETLGLKPLSAQEIQEDTEKWGEDPFVRDFSYLAEMKSLIVSAITLSENEAYAIINNQIVHVGDLVDGKKVVAIERDRVIVEKGGKRFTIFLGE
ncbi:MAG: hypothetical protein ABIK78_03290 [candidate division WOR-3 bacterium]